MSMESVAFIVLSKEVKDHDWRSIESVALGERLVLIKQVAALPMKLVYWIARDMRVDQAVAMQIEIQEWVRR